MGGERVRQGVRRCQPATTLAMDGPAIMTMINWTICAASTSGSETFVVAAMTTAVSIPPGVIDRYAVNGSVFGTSMARSIDSKPHMTIMATMAAIMRGNIFRQYAKASRVKLNPTYQPMTPNAIAGTRGGSSIVIKPAA